MNPAAAPAAEEDDDDVDLFGSDDEDDDEAARVREERLAEYRKKKEAKPKTIAKSVVTLDVKPWGKLQEEEEETLKSNIVLSHNLMLTAPPQTMRPT